jgi:hypothetical protein
MHDKSGALALKRRIVSGVIAVTVCIDDIAHGPVRQALQRCEHPAMDRFFLRVHQHQAVAADQHHNIPGAVEAAIQHV